MKIGELIRKPNIDNNSNTTNHGLSLFLSPNDNSLVFSVFLSMILHCIMLVLGYFILKFLVLILLYLGFDLSLFDRPTLKIRDIEFALVRPDTKFFTEPVKKIVLKPNANSNLAGPNPDNHIFTGDFGGLKSKADDLFHKKFEIVNEHPEKFTRKADSQAIIPLSKLPHKGTPANIKKKIPDAFTMPMPKMKPLSSAVGYGASGEKAGYHSSSASRTPMIASGEGTGGSGDSDAIGSGKRKGGGGYYYGTPGAPKPAGSGAYNNEIGDVDLRPYVTELQRKIVRNWATPKNNDNKKAVLFLRISKSGSLMILNIKASSGDSVIDNAAISAVRRAAPFNPLPTGYKSSYADVIFTFDYNVSGYKK